MALIYVIYRVRPFSPHARILEVFKGVGDLKRFLTSIRDDLKYFKDLNRFGTILKYFIEDFGKILKYFRGRILQNLAN